MGRLLILTQFQTNAQRSGKGSSEGRGDLQQGVRPESAQTAIPILESRDPAVTAARLRSSRDPGKRPPSRPFGALHGPPSFEQPEREATPHRERRPSRGTPSQPPESERGDALQGESSLLVVVERA
eukprot:scaffold100327_cov46-Phaeocystis_antarctica.AAC.1